VREKNRGPNGHTPEEDLMTIGALPLVYEKIALKAVCPSGGIEEIRSERIDPIRYIVPADGVQGVGEIQRSD